MRIGVLAIQGDVREHLQHVVQVGAEAVSVRTVADLANVEGLIIPGGESTTIGMLMQEEGLISAIQQRVANEGFPVYGTCAGLILLAKDVIGKSPARLGLMDIVADRNAYGRQVASFEADLDIVGVEGGPFHAVFIRAPQIVTVGSDVIPLAYYHDQVVMARQGSLLVSSFHPEMTEDTRIHQYFVEVVANRVMTS
ncbi:MAG: pyridoxal 5'-phosphate synthase glutaminase subunit PdxT [Sulfobacillus benefaciens]|uniref:Pyridoxal 5'-phosphate synthase subunit PdxT n=1 Tax=Sulfobacillus benefaciens TaxID=453960 RepID=A0A2T2XHL5_9FIRM|nr:MAG: pyridoxal 5'-phosphate synthase glutaminase subunit PdxT [Sulfobacillus benefaciens]